MKGKRVKAHSTHQQALITCNQKLYKDFIPKKIY